MSVREIDITTPDGKMDAKLIQPDGQGTWPAVIMITDFWGLRPTFDTMGSRLAAAGYSVLVPNVFYRARKDRSYLLMTRPRQTHSWYMALPSTS